MTLSNRVPTRSAPSADYIKQRLLRVSGELVGPSGILSVVTIWIVRAIDGEFRFVTLKPDKDES